MSSFESKLGAFLENFEQMKSVENEEAFFKEFMVGSELLCLASLDVTLYPFSLHCTVISQATAQRKCRCVRSVLLD